MCHTLIEVIYEELRNNFGYLCNIRPNSVTEVLHVDVGFGYTLYITHEEHEKFHKFIIQSNKGIKKHNKPVCFVCPINEKGYSDIVPLYNFINDFANLI